MSAQEPYGQSSQPGPPPQYGYAAAPPAGGPTNVLAIVSLVLSILGVVGVLPFIGLIAGIITGHIARRQIRSGSDQGEGLATAGLVIGYVGVLLWVLFLVVIIAVFGAAWFAVGTSP